ncbi:hypothetical protein ACIQYS_10130 [Psychrobacillus sp. NPDC096426]|uniref:hypothetical protein n=1 Tax=Psychrobacillus sp. NPDC096426 TaxID=3364491 RepID=UPI003808D90C
MNNKTISKIVHPNIHYLDVIAKMTSKGASINDLTVFQDNNSVVYSFEHFYPSIEIKFKEELHYNDQDELILWNTFVDNKLYNIFDIKKLM